MFRFAAPACAIICQVWM